ncbi:MAG: hypothetical protein LBL13_10160, partial [Bacteroidales bacterium]|nr:hypothetical protein [Bacteroidales bacterium]
MKIHIYKLLSIVLLALISLSSFGKNFKVNFNYLLFNIPNETPYVELQFLFDGKGLVYKANDKGAY